MAWTWEMTCPEMYGAQRANLYTPAKGDLKIENEFKRTKM